MTERPWPYALGIDEAAEFCGLSRSMLLKLVIAGSAPSPITVKGSRTSRAPGRKLWLRKALEEWLDELAGRGASGSTDDGGWSKPRSEGSHALRSSGSRAR